MIKYFPFFALCWSLTVGCGYAQSDDKVVKAESFNTAVYADIDTSFSFIQYDSNHLYIGPDTSLMLKLAKKWIAACNGEGTLSIVHLGASHVQGGTLSHAIRRNMLLPFPDRVGDRGLIFPYSAALKCNNPYDYKVSRSRPLLLTRNVFKEPAELLGVSGIAVTAADEPAEIGIALNDADIDFAIDSIVLLGASRGGIVPQIRIGERLLNPVTSDTTLRRYSYALDEKVDSFHIVLPCVEGQSFAVTGVYVASAKPGITVHSIGVNGAALRDYLDKCPYFNTDLTMMCPDLVIFGIGINDASGDNFDTVLFRQKYMRLIDSIRSVSPECVFLFVTNNDSFRRIRRNYIVNSNAALARDVFYRLADATGGAVWDQFSIMGGLGSMAQWQQASLAQKDKVHFTRTGYTLIGDMMSNALYETLLMLNGIDAPIGSDAAKALTRHNNAAGDGKKNDNAESGYIYY